MNSWLRSCHVALLACCLGLAAPFSGAQDSKVERHPQELRALKDPQAVLSELPAQIASARARSDFRELALLHLAEANACRVMANLACQAAAGQRAHQAAEKGGHLSLQVRGLIIESRGRLAQQDFSRTSQLLTEAERILNRNPDPEALADVHLAYSSMSYSVGKHANAVDYARRGLGALGSQPSLIIRIRLLRNLARALAQTKDNTGARAALREALVLMEGLDDPKLLAELHLEVARVARTERDVATQEASGRKILEMGERLKNTQLNGLGHEVMGLAALDRNDSKAAQRFLAQAHQHFQEFRLHRDERRVLRTLVADMLAQPGSRPGLERLMARLVALESQLEAEDRTFAADDFEARMNFFKHELDVKRLEDQAVIEKERTQYLAAQRQGALWIAALVVLLLAVLAVLYSVQRRYTQRLGESEYRYRMLADNSRDLVVRLGLDGQLLYASPASLDLLGLTPDQLLAAGQSVLHPEDREKFTRAVQRLMAQGGSINIVFRARHAQGHQVWIEAAASLVDNRLAGSGREIVYSGRDITARVEAERALATSEARLRAVTDSIPALIAHIDREERYTFANGYMGRVFGTDPKSVLGLTMREVRGEEIYSFIAPYVQRALRGESVKFEGRGMVGGREYHYQSHYVPDTGPDGSVAGFFALTFDITNLKQAEAELERLVRIDSMTGVANRRHFDERLATAIASASRHGTALCLVYLDVDRFKAINDTHGHAAGDAVIIEIATRLRSLVRKEDLVARLGGDEFALIIEQAGPESGEAIAVKVLEAMQVPIPIGTEAVQVKVSIGVAYCTHPDTFEHVLGMADRALYQSKSAGRGTFSIEAPGPAGDRREPGDTGKDQRSGTLQD